MPGVQSCMERPTRPRVSWGESPLPSVARIGRQAIPMPPEVTKEVLLGENATAAQRCRTAAVGTTWVASKPGGLNVTEYLQPRNSTPPRSRSAESRKAPTRYTRGEGRSREGRNGQVHLASHRGKGSGIRGRTRGDNVGKGQNPAGADGNLQRPVERRRSRRRREGDGLTHEPV